MRFTPSKDGKERADVRITFRLSRDELAAIQEAAKADDTPWREWLMDAAEDGIWRAVTGYAND